MDTWPITLPQIALLEGWRLAQPHRPKIVTEMEDGPARMRKRTTAAWSQMPLAFLMTNAQFTTFHTFVRDNLEDGAVRFLMPVWAPWRLNGLPARTVYLEGGDYSAERAGFHMRVTMTLNVLDW